MSRGVGTNKKCCLSSPGQPRPLGRCEDHTVCTLCVMNITKHEKWKIKSSDQTLTIQLPTISICLSDNSCNAHHRTQNENWLTLNGNNCVMQRRRQRCIWLAQSLTDATRTPHSALLPRSSRCRLPTGSLSALEPHPQNTGHHSVYQDLN